MSSHVGPSDIGISLPLPSRNASAAELVALTEDVVGVALPTQDREALDVLWSAIAARGLGAAGKRAATLNVTGSLLANLSVRRHAPVATPKHTQRPIVIVGLPRTATTFLHNALSAHGSWFTYYESLDPSAAAIELHGDEQASSRLREWADTRQRFQHKFAPNLQDIHPMPLDGPEECGSILGHSFNGLQWLILFDIPAYREWLDTADATAPYDLWKASLDVMSASRRTDAGWILKFPGHLAHIDQIFRVFPNALVVWTHRDIDTAMASWCHLLETVRTLTMRAPQDRLALGEETLNRWIRSYKHAAEFVGTTTGLTEIGSGHVLSVDFERVVTKTEEVVAEILELADRPASAAKIAEGLAAANSVKGKAQTPSLTDYWLAGTIKDRFLT